MKAKSKKRLLISSVAMLLVAMLALGTATFAWFTTSTSTIANGINVATVKSSNLKISQWDHRWVDGFSYNHENLLYKPTSSADGITWYTATAASKDNYAKTGDFSTQGTIAQDLGSGSSGGIINYVYMNELNVKNEGDATATNVKITISGTFSDYVRVAVVPCDANHKTTGTFTSCVYGKDATQYTPAPATGSPATTITPIATREITCTPVGNGKTAGTFEKNDCAYYRIFVWFEGQDIDCYDLNGGQTLPDLSFAVSGDTGSV